MSSGSPSQERPAQSGCLNEAAVQRVAHGDGTTAELEHLASCPRCGERAREARNEADFLGRARGLLGQDLGPIGAPRLAGYRPLGVISTGAQGVVYQARQESTQRIVAIKVLAAEPQGANTGDVEHGTASATRRRMRAEREVEIIARLRHPNIVAVHESRTIGDETLGGGRVALVMEYVDGVPLDQWKPPGAATEAERLRAALRVFVAVCAGVHHAHLNGVIHRDLKPDNILVTAEGRPVVLDFGIAKLNAVAGGGSGGLNTTATGDFAGTPAYASPEQVSGKSDEINALTDVYSLGVILYRLVCRALPYDLGESIFEAARVINAVEPVPPHKHDPAVPRDLEAVILRALRKEKTGRYQSAAALGQDVERFLAGEPVEARSESGWYLLRKAVMVNRKRLGLVAAAAALVIAAGVAVGVSLSSARESAKLAESRKEQARAEHVRARAVTELLREAMPNTDPQRPDLAFVIGKGLGRLYYRLESGAFADDPEVDQEIRRLWGGVYTGFGAKAAEQVPYAEVSLRHGLVRLRQDHKGDPRGHPEIASSLHQLAAVLLFRKRYGEAEQTCREALEMRERLLGPGNLFTCESSALLARVLAARCDRAAAERAADAALAGLAPLPERDANLLIASMQGLKARLRLDERSPAAAEPLLTNALVRRLRALPPDDPDLLASLADAAELVEAAPNTPLGEKLRSAWGPSSSADGAAVAAAVRRDIPVIRQPTSGDFKIPVITGRTDALGRFIRLQESLLGRDHPALIGTLLMQVEAATGEARLDDRWAADLRAAEIVSARLGPDHFAVLVCIQDAAVAFAFSGKPDRAVDLAHRSCQIWDAVPESSRDKLMSANARRYLLWFLSIAGRHQEAVEAGRVAIERLTAAVGPDHHILAFCEATVARSQLVLGNHEEADRRSRRASAIAEASPSIPIDQRAHVDFLRGHILFRLPGLTPDRRLEARRLLERSWADYYYSVGKGYAGQVEMVQDMIDICEQTGDDAGVRLWRERFPLTPGRSSP